MSKSIDGEEAIDGAADAALVDDVAKTGTANATCPTDWTCGVKSTSTTTFDGEACFVGKPGGTAGVVVVPPV